MKSKIRTHVFTVVVGSLSSFALLAIIVCVGHFICRLKAPEPGEVLCVMAVMVAVQFLVVAWQVVEDYIAERRSRRK